MKPLNFKESTIEFKKPKSMTNEECSSLHLYQDLEKGQCISLWSTSFWERLKFLFHGKLWVGILSGAKQPPIWLDMTKSVFIK